MNKKTIRIALVAVTAAGALALFACGSQSASTTSGTTATTASTTTPTLTVSTPVVATSDTTPSMNKHESMGVTCAECHGTAAPTSAPTSDEACLGCHDQTTLIASTAGYEDLANRSVNPHDNHMHGTSCFSCHSNHGESTLACNDCHTNEYGWIVP